MEKCRLCMGELHIIGQLGDDMAAGRCRSCGYINVFEIPYQDMEEDRYGEEDYYHD